MEKRLEKAQVQAARLAWVREQREKKEAQRARIREQEEARRELEEEEEREREQKRQAVREHAEREYQRWKSGFVKVVRPAAELCASREELKDKVEEAILEEVKGQSLTSVIGIAKRTKLTLSETKEAMRQMVKDKKVFGIFSAG